MRLVNEHDLALEAAKLEAKVKKEAEAAERAGKAVIGWLGLPIDAAFSMLLVGALHAQPHLHGVPAIGYLTALGIHALVHIVTPSK